MRAAAVVLLVAAGCSSVPDVTFVDDDAGVDAAIAPVVDAATPVTPVGTGPSCPDHPPAASDGICCGSRLCLHCNFLQCARCEQESCKTDEVCCAKGMGLGGGNMSCSAATACN